MKVPLICKPASSLENKTGSWRTTKRPKLDAEKCIGCQQCVFICPEASIRMNENKKAEIDYDFCKGCGLCAGVCPVKAIEMVEEDKK